MNPPSRKLWIAPRDDLASLIARLWQGISQEALQKRGRFTVALSGGNTPAFFYRKLASMGEVLPWGKTHIFQVDERWVPPDHPDRNFRVIRENLIQGATIPPQQIHPIPLEPETPEEAARAYETEIRQTFADESPRIPSLDLIWLGIGSDGHTASLFPGHPALEEKKRWVRAVRKEEWPSHRITLTLPLLNQGRHILFVVTGREKKRILKRILEEGASDHPASKVIPVSGDIFFFLDPEAAGSD